MTAHPESLNNRMDRVEATLASAGELLLQASRIAQLNADSIQVLTQRLDAVTQRIDSLAAASEQHERILDYLLRKEADNSDMN